MGSTSVILIRVADGGLRREHPFPYRTILAIAMHDQPRHCHDDTV